MKYDPHEIAEVFGRTAAAYDSVIPFFAGFGAGLVEFAALRPGESVLDVGCGRGATLFPAAERVGPQGRVLGVDLSEEMVRLLQDDIGRRGLAQASARRMDAGALDVDPESFDVAVSSFVLHLLPDPEAAALGITTALRAGGRLAAASPIGLVDPAWDFLPRILRSCAARVGHPMVVPFRPEFDVAASLEGAGLKVTRAAGEQLEFHFPDEQAWWDWAWTQGMRGLLEILPPDHLDSLRLELFAELRPLRTETGIPMTQSAAYVLAEKPAG